MKIKNDFSSYVSNKYGYRNLTRKLQNWHEHSFGDFIKELNKAIKKENRDRKKDAGENAFIEIPELTKKDEFEWMELFEVNKKKAQELQTQIASTEKEIDQIVYDLYGLTEEEIRIVEKN